MSELDLIVCAIRNITSYADLAGEWFDALTESMHVSALICDGKGLIAFANRQGLKMLHATQAGARKLRSRDFLVGDGLDLVERMTFQSEAFDRNPLDGVLIDTRGTRHRVAMLVHPMDRTSSGELQNMILLVPENKRMALSRALQRSGSASDYISPFLLQAQEGERKRIAADLHDGLGQVLTMLKFQVEDALIRLNAGNANEGKDILKEVVVQLRGAVGDVRRISTELRPSMLDDLGLLPTLHWLSRQFEAAHSGITVTLDIKIEEENIPIPLKIPIFRLIQEATNNIAKHAHATKVFIYLRVHYDGFLVGVVDNGVGFDAERLTSGGACLLGIGINSMRERVEASRGGFRIRSYIGSGTAIRAVWGSPRDNSQWLCADSLEDTLGDDDLHYMNTQTLNLNFNLT